jgi:FdrA protein
MITIIVKENAYFDSITLMKVSQELRKIEALQEVQVAMGTDHNKSLLKDSNLWTEEVITAKPNDLCIAFSSKDGHNEKEVLKVVEEALYGNKNKGESDLTIKDSPKTIADAVAQNPSINLALISVPGEYATYEAKCALDKNINVMMFSDNVSVANEKKLKELAAKKNLLMMGPDCGTAIINGVGLGFSNKVRSGNIGIVGASGTGIQEISILLDRIGLGISQAIGTGGRDLNKEIGALSMKQGLKLLASDDQTDIIAIVSKPPDAEVARDILQVASLIKKPVVVCFLGHDNESNIISDNICFSDSLTQTVTEIARIAGCSHNLFDTFKIPKYSLEKDQKKIFGLFCGGTLCSEAQNIIGLNHLCIDFGEDEYTKGKPHPMIDPTTRNEAFLEVANKEETAIILFDVVLGFGSHENPALNLSPIIQKINNSKKIIFIASVCGSEDDPQCYSIQSDKLRSLGVIVAPSNAIAAEVAKTIINNESLEQHVAKYNSSRT